MNLMRQLVKYMNVVSEVVNEIFGCANFYQ